ncbi:MAG: transposase [Herminiimonas sp.]|nr:transposase [Herminiimonas sp.]
MQHYANPAKVNLVLDLFRAYPKAAQQIAAVQWRCFFDTGAFKRNLPIHIASPLSARFKQTCQYQVVGMLNSFIANRANDFKDAVMGIPDAILAAFDARHSERAWLGSHGRPVSYTRVALLYLGKYRAWYRAAPAMKGLPIPAEILRLARSIMRGVFARHRRPSMGQIQMLLDEKVARIEATRSMAEHTPFAYWVKLATLRPGKPISIPIHANVHYESVAGERMACVQINLGERGLSIGFVKDVPVTPYAPRMEVLGVDVGLRYLVATSAGDLMGRGLLDRLIVWDRQITALAANRQKQGLRVRSRRYDTLVARVRSFLKNEINRVLNRLLAVRQPDEIVIESLDFRSPDLSRRMNRLVQNFGRTVFRQALAAKAEQFGFTATEVNAAYTSQSCAKCGYVDKKNRRAERFTCRHCSHTAHADINAAMNIRNRRSVATMASRWVSQSAILEALVRQFLERCTQRPYSRPGSGILSNPYFLGFAGWRTESSMENSEAPLL